MEFSMDGLRRNLITKSNNLFEAINNEDYFDITDVKKEFNELVNSIGFLCCTECKGEENYTDMSDVALEIRRFDN